MRQDNVAEFDFREHKDALLSKMWQTHAADVHGRRTRQTCKAKTFDAIAVSVKVEFPLALLQLLQKLDFSRLIVITVFASLSNS